MIHRISISSLVVIAWWCAVLPINAQVNVTQKQNNLSRDGLYIDSAFTPSAAASVARDLNFNGTIVGNVYAQPLYIENGPGGAAMVIAVTESNNVYALNAATGAVIWQRNVGTPITSGLPCGIISPLGITGTPIVDLSSRALFFDAETTPSSGVFRHMIYSLNVDTGATFGTGGTWGGGEAVIRLLPGPIFSGSTTDYWAPANWFSLDGSDLDLGGSGAVLVDVPGATPSALVVALGKDGNAYLLNRSNLGGISTPVASANVNSSSRIVQAAASYRTGSGTYVVFRGSASVTTAFRI